jgi:integrase
MTTTSNAIRHQQIAGHLQVRGDGNRRRYLASWWDRDGKRRTTKLGPAHVKDSGRRTARGAVIWRAAPGPCPSGFLTPKMAEEALEAILEEARATPAEEPVRSSPAPVDDIPTFGDAVDAWLAYLEVERRRKKGTVVDARNVAKGNLLPRFGRDTPLYSIERQEIVVRRNGRQFVELREERRDTFTTDDVDAYRRELLASHLSPRTAQKVLVLLHGVFKLAKRRKLIASNPSEDAERITLEDPGIFNILEPVEFEAVYRAVLLQQDDRPEHAREEDAIDALTGAERQLFGALLSTAFYAGPRLGEVRDLPWRNVDFDGAMIRVESGYTRGARSTPKGKRARSTPMVSILAQRLAALSTRDRFTADADYVFSNGLGERIGDARIRKVFYAALVRAGLGHRRDTFDPRGNPQVPIRIHDLRHSWCTWAVNVWELTKVQAYAGHRDVKTTQRYVHHKTKAQDADLGGAYLEAALAQPAFAGR